jgi:group I intron endonuclease
MSQNEERKRRAELKEKYKEMEKPTGVYQIRNNVNGKVYIGSCVDINSMFNRLRFELKTGLKRIPELQNEWKQYGEDNFIFEILEELKIKEGEFQDVKHELQKLEEKWLDRIQPYEEKGYNKRPKER